VFKVDNLYKNYGKFRAVDQLSFEVKQGEIFGFVGSNGAGKSTTMKVAAGLLKATSGTIYINGIDISKNPILAKSFIGYMPDFFGVYDDLKTYEYMNFYCGVHQIPVKERDKVITNLIELVGLTDKMNAYVDDLSRGMKQRLCLARALIHNPEILILDEPASGLDPRARVEFRDIVKTLSKMGKTIIISSHILLELAEMCTTIGIIEKGKLVAIGTVSDIQKQLSHLSRLKIKTTDDSEALVLFLKQRPEITEILEGHGYVECSFSGDDHLKASLLQALIEAGFKVYHFEETAGNLESIFMHLTKEEDHD
jgi:ABC-2 type transport system ATP-binding protein